MSLERQQLEAGIAALETQRGRLGDAVADASLAGLRARLAELDAEAAAPAQARRQVTILFLDLVGSTELAHRLDLEDVHAVMDGALARCTAIVQAHHGRVLQYAGDGLLAAFGADASREDDAELAVRCGLDLLDEGRRSGEGSAAVGGELCFRAGIHTGSVLLGGGVDAEGTIRGLPVHIAARMQQSAPAGGLRISLDTWALVRGRFDADEQPAIAIKGLDAPMRSMLVRRARPRALRTEGRGIEGVATRMIGRDAELRGLQDAFERMFGPPVLATVMVVGEAGLGKSRLLAEFDAWREARREARRVAVFHARAHPDTQARPYGLLRDLLARWLRIADDDTLPAAQARFTGGVVPLFAADGDEDLAEGHAHLLGHLVGLDFGSSRHVRGIRDDPAQIRQRGFHAAAQLLRHVAATGRVAILLELEDLHWADDSSLDFLDHLREVAHDLPMLIVGLARPAFFERREAWRGPEAAVQRIGLAPLDAACSRQLAAELLCRLPEVPAAISELITGRAEGNPFYMEELVRMLVDQGAIETGPQQWTVRPDLLFATRLPSTLTGVLQARLDGLPTADKQALQAASVIGPVFWDRALAALEPQAADRLPELVRRELVLPRAALEGLHEYAFRHQILHRVTYDTVLRRDRRRWHARAARWLAGLDRVSAQDFLGLIAEHFERADEAAPAVEYHRRAAEQASQRYAHEAVAHHVQRAIKLLERSTEPGRDAQRWALLSLRERALDLQGRRDAQRADLDALQALAQAAGDERLRGDLAWRRADLAYRTADHAALEALSRRALESAERLGDASLALRSLQLLAIARSYSGDDADSRALAEQGLQRARRLAWRSHEAQFLDILSNLAGQRDDLIGSLALYHQTLPIACETGDRRLEANTLCNAGATWLALGALEPALDHLSQGLRLVRANGDRAMEGVALCNLSLLALWQGRADDALDLARSGLAIALAVEARLWKPAALMVLGEAELALGRLPQAAQAFEQAQDAAAAVGHRWRHDACAGRVRVALRRGDADAAIALARPLLDLAADPGALESTDQPRLIELSCHQVLERAGDPRAAQWLQRAHDALLARAASLAEPALRDSFLQRIPHHREILAAFAASQPRDPPPA